MLPKSTREASASQLGWREFAYHLLCHNPESPHQALRPEFAAFPWRINAELCKAWQRGRTGYPLVDAGMRELWRVGWMHNRVRMVVASFLVKHLPINWQAGAAWFCSDKSMHHTSNRIVLVCSGAAADRTGDGLWRTLDPSAAPG